MEPVNLLKKLENLRDVFICKIQTFLLGIPALFNLLIKVHIEAIYFLFICKQYLKFNLTSFVKIFFILKNKALGIFLRVLLNLKQSLNLGKKKLEKRFY